VSRLRYALDSPSALFALISVFVALVSLWTITIPKVGSALSFANRLPHPHRVQRHIDVPHAQV
jgi:hypothetical protein